MPDTKKNINDLIIIGGGPAGIASGIYAARKKISTVLLTETIGGQSVVSDGIENWIGTVKISGADLANALRTHINAYKDGSVDVREGTTAKSIERNGDGVFTVTTNTDDKIYSRSVFIGSGASRRKLDIPGADKFENKGVTYCASCDGPLFSDQDVAIIGGGNAGFETAAQLLSYAKSVTLIHKQKDFRADPITVSQLLKNEKMSTLTESEPVEVLGDKFVTGVVIKNSKTGETTELPVSGVFVEIGVIPNTWFAEDILELNDAKYIKVDPLTQRASTDGVWAAGDCTNGLYHQNNIAVGDAVKATEDLYHWLATK